MVPDRRQGCGESAAASESGLVRQSEWGPRGVAPAVVLEKSCAFLGLALPRLGTHANKVKARVSEDHGAGDWVVLDDDAIVEDCRNSLLQGDLGIRCWRNFRGCGCPAWALEPRASRWRRLLDYPSRHVLEADWIKLDPEAGREFMEADAGQLSQGTVRGHPHKVSQIEQHKHTQHPMSGDHSHDEIEEASVCANLAANLVPAVSSAPASGRRSPDRGHPGLFQRMALVEGPGKGGGLELCSAGP